MKNKKNIVSISKISKHSCSFFKNLYLDAIIDAYLYNTLFIGEEYYSWEEAGGDGYKYVCQVCNKSFDISTSLNHHMKTHTGQTSCTICGKVMSRVGHLKRHMKSVHPEYC